MKSKKNPIICSHCGKDNGSLNEVRDFRGNPFAVVCGKCQKYLNGLLDVLFWKYGGVKQEWGLGYNCSCRNSPHITDIEHLKELTSELSETPWRII